jgi:hypothetical protein
VGKFSIAYSTYFGGANAETTTPLAVGGGIAVDANQIIYFTGTTNFTFSGNSVGDFPILDAYQPCLDQPPPASVSNPPTCANSSTDTNTDAFVAKLNPNVTQGQQLVWSTYLGAGGVDSGTGIALDPGAANVYITGTTNSTNFVIPTGTASFQSTPGGLNDAFVARFPNLTPTSTNLNLQLAYFSYLGGSGNEAGLAIAADSSNGALVTGSTQSTNFPVFPANSEIQSALNGPQDAFVARINTVAASGTNTAASWSTYFGGNNYDEGTSITLDFNQNTIFAGDTDSTANLLVTGLFTQNAGGYDAFVTELKSAANVTIVGVPTLGTNQEYFWAGVPAQFTYTLTNNGPDLATGLTFSDNLSASPVTLTNPSGSVTGGTCSGGGSTTSTSLTCAIGSLQAGSTATVTVSVTPTATTGGSSGVFNGGAVEVLGQNDIVLANALVPAKLADFTMQVNPPNNSVSKAGLTAGYEVKLLPNPVYGANITLSCSAPPSGSTCAFTPSTVTLQGSSPATATLSISTTARPITTGSAQSLFGRFYGVWLALPGLALLGVGASGKRRHRIFGMLLLCVLLAQLLPLPACGGSTTQPPASGTPPGNWPITVTATSGSDAKSQGIVLTVP